MPTMRCSVTVGRVIRTIQLLRGLALPDRTVREYSTEELDLPTQPYEPHFDIDLTKLGAETTAGYCPESVSRVRVTASWTSPK